MECETCKVEMEYHEILGCYECNECGHIEIVEEIKYEYQGEQQ